MHSTPRAAGSRPWSSSSSTRPVFTTYPHGQPQARSFLITEALRGEGALLRLPDGTRFMTAHGERGERAARDIVARAIDFEMKKHGLDCVLLDATHLGEAFLKSHFPIIHARCLQLGIDIAAQPIERWPELLRSGRRRGVRPYSGGRGCP